MMTFNGLSKQHQAGKRIGLLTTSGNHIQTPDKQNCGIGWGSLCIPRYPAQTPTKLSEAIGLTEYRASSISWRPLGGRPMRMETQFLYFASYSADNFAG